MTAEERYVDLVRLFGNLRRRELRWRRRCEQLERENAELRAQVAR